MIVIYYFSQFYTMEMIKEIKINLFQLLVFEQETFTYNFEQL